MNQESNSVLDAMRPQYEPVPDADAPEVMGFFTDTSLCIGCKACEVACKQWNQLPADGLNFTSHSYDNTCRLSETTWRHVAFKEQFDGSKARWLMLSDVCKHCQDAPCVQSCPTGSLIYNEFGNVYLQPDICNGCAYCIGACPFGVLGRSEDDGHAHKCTLCYDRQKDGMQPACAKACPTGSIEFGPVSQLREKAKQRVEDLHKRGDNDAYLYGAESLNGYGALNSFFLLEENPNEYNLPEAPKQPLRGQTKRYAASLATGFALAAFAALAIKSSTRK